MQIVEEAIIGTTLREVYVLQNHLVTFGCNKEGRTVLF